MIRKSPCNIGVSGDTLGNNNGDAIMGKIEFKFPRLPESTDHLFRSSNDWWNNASLNYMPDSWEIYISGYKKAADILVNKIKETKVHKDFLVYPIVFLYRQYLELRLKELIKEGNKLLGTYSEFPKNHELYKLWENSRKILEEVFPEESKEELDIMIHGGQHLYLLIMKKLLNSNINFLVLIFFSSILIR